MLRNVACVKLRQLALGWLAALVENWSRLLMTLRYLSGTAEDEEAFSLQSTWRDKRREALLWLALPLLVTSNCLDIWETNAWLSLYSTCTRLCELLCRSVRPCLGLSVGCWLLGARDLWRLASDQKTTVHFSSFPVPTFLCGRREVPRPLSPLAHNSFDHTRCQISPSVARRFFKIETRAAH